LIANTHAGGIYQVSALRQILLILSLGQNAIEAWQRDHMVFHDSSKICVAIAARKTQISRPREVN
jgi:hypothetical protein